MAQGVAAGAPAPPAGSTQDWGSPRSRAAAPRSPKGPRRRSRSRGAAPPRATRAGIPNPRLRLLPAPGRLTCGQRRAASAGVDGTCAASPTGLRPPPPPHRGRQAQAAHLDARRCGSLGSDDAAPPHRPRGRRWSERGSVEPGPPPPPPQPPRVPETGRPVPVPGEESRAAGHHERQQRQHHLRQPQAAQARAENVSVGPSASSPRGLGVRARGCGRRPPFAPKSGRSGD